MQERPPAPSRSVTPIAGERHAGTRAQGPDLVPPAGAGGYRGQGHAGHRADRVQRGAQKRGSPVDHRAPARGVVAKARLQDLRAAHRPLHHHEIDLRGAALTQQRRQVARRVDRLCVDQQPGADPVQPVHGDRAERQRSRHPIGQDRFQAVTERQRPFGDGPGDRDPGRLVGHEHVLVVHEGGKAGRDLPRRRGGPIGRRDRRFVRFLCRSGRRG